jgi:hypothetical protein
MAVPWMKVFDTVSSLAQLSGTFRRPSGEGPESSAAAGETPSSPLAPLEARLAGVVVAALHEAFDRDRVRMDMERSQVEAEQRRAAEALAAELRRQAAERVLGQLRLIALIAIGIWMVSAILAAWLPGMRDGLPRLMLGGGWAVADGSACGIGPGPSSPPLPPRRRGARRRLLHGSCSARSRSWPRAFSWRSDHHDYCLRCRLV